jgi:excisionase family DNA binding protein
MINDCLLTGEELSQRIRLTPGTIRVWVSQKKIPYVKMGRKVLFDWEDIQRWIKEKKVDNKEF